MSEALHPRLHAVRPDLADSRLEGQVAAARFVAPTPRRVIGASAALKRDPRPDAAVDTELLRGEAVAVFEETPEGWSWVQNAVDGYVGYVSSDALGGVDPAPTHRVAALRTFVYPGPDMKLPATAWLSLGSAITLGGEVETRGTSFRLLAGGEGAVVARHLVSVDAPAEPDFVAVAERFRETPYLWGGRTSLGLDCSGLVQLALMTAGKACPRDTDMQETGIGRLVEGGVEASLERGDLIFWPGHVGILRDPDTMLHASGHHMQVVAEPLGEAIARIGAPRSVRRL
ncbi:C40 family peptidase [Bauldia litoralis]|uniref:NlpC/P60 family protein n=1 Tax=Bauldia litoralis TaxID=665467 RepID=A0A1G6EFE8_9HYPH|nr:NlpC/P60 family protein [Bauldia litoralis]SDB56096.1 NlpC/P60 family protein [Bauldia litoralis]